MKPETRQPPLPPRWFIRSAWHCHRALFRVSGGRAGLWRLNLQAHPDAEIQLVDGSRPVTGRAAEGEERERLWARWRQIDEHLDAYAARRSKETAVVVLEPGSRVDGLPSHRERGTWAPVSGRGGRKDRHGELAGGVQEGGT